MAGERKLTVILAGDHKGLTSALDGAGKSADGFGSKLAAVGKVAALGFAAVGVAAVAGAKSAIDAASNLNETLSKSNTVFKDQAGAIENWANGSAKALGQSKQQALEAASSFGNMFIQLGIGSEKAAGMSTKMTELASDFASFHNADITEVLQAQQAAFRGEYDSVQRFVPTINAAAVEQKALAMGLKGSTKELTAQDKALATQQLLLEGAGDAAGDFARTSDGLANKQRILSARFEDIKAKIGNALMPVATALAGVFADKVLPAFEAVGQGLQAFVSSWQYFDGEVTSSGFAGFMERAAFQIRSALEALIPIVVAVGEAFMGVFKFIADNEAILAGFASVIGVLLVRAVVQWTVATMAQVAALWAQAAAFAAANAPLIAIIAAVAALTTAVVYAYQNWGWFRDAVDAVAQFLTGTLWPALQTVAGFITDTVIPIVARLIGIWIDLHKKGVEVAVGIVTKFGEVVGFFTTMPGKISSAAAGMWDGIKNAFRSAINWIIRAWNALEFKIPGFDPPGPGPKFGGFTLGVPNIRELHGGGLFRSSSPGGEGLALLRDRERVLTPNSTMGGGGTVINIYPGAFAGAIVGDEREMQEWVVSALNQATANGIR